MEYIERLSKILDEKNITAYKLCKDLNLPKNTINNWKNGSLPKIDKFAEIVNYLEISPYFLLGIENKNEEFCITEQEKEIIKAYRNVSKEVQKIVKTTLDISKKSKEDIQVERSSESKTG